MARTSAGPGLRPRAFLCPVVTGSPHPRESLAGRFARAPGAFWRTVALTAKGAEASTTPGVLESLDSKLVEVAARERKPVQPPGVLESLDSKLLAVAATERKPVQCLPHARNWPDPR
jgi:hypothetical protein